MISDNQLNDIIKLHEEKNKRLEEKLLELSQEKCGSDYTQHFSCNGNNYYGPSIFAFKMIKKHQIEKETIEKILDLAWERYCTIKGDVLW
jgi:hypothetical protein